MEFITLASGSKGNVTYIKINDINILIDLGISCTKLLSLLEDKKINVDKIEYLLITHTHSDHIKGLEVFLKKYNPTIISSEIVLRELNEKMLIKKSIVIDDKLLLKNIEITKIQSSHDSLDCVGFVFEENFKSLVYITDTGYINSKYHKLIENKNIYLIESNYDDEMLLNGNYPYHLKKRILSDTGHLSNKDCARYLKKVIGENTKCIGLLHLSEENNNPKIVLDTINSMLKQQKLEVSIFIAKQDEAGDMIYL